VRGTIVCDVTDLLEGYSAAQFGRAIAARLGLRVVLAAVDVRPSEDFGGDVELRLAGGDHAEALARVAAEEGADLIIVGSRAVGFGGRNLRCSLAKDLEAATPVPVLVAPPATRRRSDRRLAVAAAAR
jgi:nucleotide-binding universal stress UspA family protein